MNFYELDRKIHENVLGSIQQSMSQSMGGHGQGQSLLSKMAIQPFNPAKYVNPQNYNATQFQELIISYLGQFGIQPRMIENELRTLTQKATSAYTQVQQYKRQVVQGQSQNFTGMQTQTPGTQTPGTQTPGTQNQG